MESVVHGDKCKELPTSSKEHIDYERSISGSREPLDKDTTENLSVPIRHLNGQRLYGPPSEFTGPPPPKGSVVFVGGIPRDCHEPELIPFFERIGKVFQLRIMLELNGNNKGYCFVEYYTPEDAEKAIQELNDLEIRDGWRIGVVPCINRNTIFLCNIPKHKKEDDIKFELTKLVDGIIRVSAPKSKSEKAVKKNKGYAFVEFENRSFALDFLDKFYPNKLILWGFIIQSRWAERPSDASAQGIIVTNISFHTNERVLQVIFNGATNGGVVKVEKLYNCASIYFKSKQHAKLAKRVMNHKVIDGHVIKIEMNNIILSNAMHQNFKPDFNLNDENNWSQTTSIPFTNEQNYLPYNDHFPVEGQHKEFERSKFNDDLRMDLPYVAPAYESNSNSCFPTYPQSYNMMANDPQGIHPAYFQPPNRYDISGYSIYCGNDNYFPNSNYYSTVPVATIRYYHPLLPIIPPIPQRNQFHFI